MHFQLDTFTISLGILVLSSPAIATDGVLDEGNEEYSCFGLGCQRRGAYGEFNSSVPCRENDVGNVFPNKEDCHSFYLCTENRTALKLQCPPDYGFDSEYQICIPEYRVKACKVVHCPPYIFDGVVADLKNCKAYYRCLYGFVYHYRCAEGSVFDPNQGICRPYTAGNEPDCLKEPVSPSPTTTTTPLPFTESSTWKPDPTTNDVIITRTTTPKFPSTNSGETTAATTLEPVTASETIITTIASESTTIPTVTDSSTPAATSTASEPTASSSVTESATVPTTPPTATESVATQATSNNVDAGTGITGSTPNFSVTTEAPLMSSSIPPDADIPTTSKNL